MQLRPEGRSRGQVIIVAALVIAAIFVGLALVLNSGIYAENLSSRETTDTEGALSFTLETNEAIAEAYERTNDANESSADDAEATFNGTVDSWEAAQQRRGAMQGIGIDVEHTAHVGWRLEQNTTQDFTPNDNTTSNWNLTSDADGVATFEMNVTKSSLYNIDDAWDNVNDSYHVRVARNGGSPEWNLYVFQNSSSVIVHNGVPGEHSDVSDLPDSDTCTVDGTHVVIDFQNESLADSRCEALNFSDDLNDPIDISYRNPDQVTGTYTLVANGTDAAEKTHFDDPNNGNPTAQAIVYSVSYASHYEKADMTYERRGTHAVREETYAS